MSLEKHGIMASKLATLVLSGKLTGEDKKEAVQAANVLRLTEEYMEGTRQSTLPLDILIDAECVYARLVGDNA
jgi:hypothetical protein